MFGFLRLCHEYSQKKSVMGGGVLLIYKSTAVVEQTKTSIYQT